MERFGQTILEDGVEREARIPDGTRVYAVGDVHGRVDLLREMRGLIAADIATAPTARVVVVWLGDYVDRGPDSFEVVDDLIFEPVAGATQRFLCGNHEDMMVHFLEDESRGSGWLMNGGFQTLLSYGVAIGAEEILVPGILTKIRDDLTSALPMDHRRFLEGLDLVHVEGDFLFVHAGVRPGIPFHQQGSNEFLWIRREFLKHEGPLEKVVVHGHSIQPFPDVQSNRIGVDTGAYRTGTLSCVVLEGSTRRFLST